MHHLHIIIINTLDARTPEGVAYARQNGKLATKPPLPVETYKSRRQAVPPLVRANNSM